MSEKKYTIVMVDRDDEDFKCPTCPSVAQSCCDCKIIETYGDTKEQLIRKVAQIRFKQETQYGSKDMLKAIYNMCYRQAKEIVEFLGVEDERKIVDIIRKIKEVNK